MTEFKYLDFSPLTVETMEKWSVDEFLRFSDQDEDLLLAGKDNLPLLFMFLHKEATLPSKKDLILTALGVLLYGPINHPDLYAPTAGQLIQEIQDKLKKNKDIALKRLTDESNDIPVGYMVILYWALGEPLPEPLATDARLVEKYYAAFEKKYLSLTEMKG